MENNGQQNAQGQNSEAVVPSLGQLLGNDPIISSPTPEPVNPNEQQPAGTQPQEGQTTQVVPPVPPVPPTSPAAPQEGVSPIKEMTIESLLSANDATLTEEDRELKRDLFSVFNAQGVDAQGNLVNAQNQIVLSKANLDNYVATGEVLTDAAGNQIDEQGNIIKSAQDVTPSSTITEVSKSLIEQELGFQFLDEEGKPKTYSNSAEGNAELIRDAINNAQVNAISSFLSANPKLKDIYFHLANGGDLQSYTSNDIDYSAVDVSTLDRDAKLNYIKQSFDKQGLKNAESLIKTLELASDEALTQATADAVLALKQVTDEDKIRREKAYEQQQQQEAKNLEDYWNDMNSVIKTGKLKDIQIPETEKDAFFKYIALPANSKGESQEMIDAEQEDAEYRLTLSYLRFKKFDLSKLVNNKAGVTKIASLRERLGKANPRIENAQARTNGQQTSLDAAGFPTLQELTNRQ